MFHLDHKFICLIEFIMFEFFIIYVRLNDYFCTYHPKLGKFIKIKTEILGLLKISTIGWFLY